MAIAGAVVVPVKENLESALKSRLDALQGVEVQGAGSKGIAIVLMAADMAAVKEISKEINGWEEVVELQVAYMNWEEMLV